MTIKREFVQDGPILGNQFSDDGMFREYLRQKLSPDAYAKISTGLFCLGHRAVTDILQLGNTAEYLEPRHEICSPWGEREDRIIISPAWEELGRIAVNERLVATAYEREFGDLSRIVQFARVYLFAASSAVYTCPLAMSDGAARVLERYGTDSQRERFFNKLVSRDPKGYWTSGQWMTEREGGSDVSRTSTVARPTEDGYCLYGIKHFASSANSPMALALARIEGDPQGNRGLSLFVLRTKNDDGTWNGITVNRLKDKMGTKAVPTAELVLSGAKAELVGARCSGVKQIASMLNITRIWNSCEAVALMRRGIALARNYSYRREVFGERLSEKPAFKAKLQDMKTEFSGAFFLTFRAAELLGKEEAGTATNEELSLLRLIVPIAKLFTAAQAVWVAGQAQECFAGAGYMEDTGIPQLVRNAHVLPIWEGTPEVLALDAFRVLLKTDALNHFAQDVSKRMSAIARPDLAALARRIQLDTDLLTFTCRMLFYVNKEAQEARAPDIARSIARLAIAVELAIAANQCVDEHEGMRLTCLLEHWLTRPLVYLPPRETGKADVIGLE